MFIKLNNLIVDTINIESIFKDEELKEPKYIIYLKSGKYYIIDETEYNEISKIVLKK